MRAATARFGRNGVARDDAPGFDLLAGRDGLISTFAHSPSSAHSSKCLVERRQRLPGKRRVVLGAGIEIGCEAESISATLPNVLRWCDPASRRESGPERHRRQAWRRTRRHGNRGGPQHAVRQVYFRASSRAAASMCDDARINHFLRDGCRLLGCRRDRRIDPTHGIVECLLGGPVGGPYQGHFLTDELAQAIAYRAMLDPRAALVRTESRFCAASSNCCGMPESRKAITAPGVMGR
jgi:hypothetical protein